MSYALLYGAVRCGRLLAAGGWAVLQRCCLHEAVLWRAVWRHVGALLATSGRSSPLHLLLPDSRGALVRLRACNSALNLWLTLPAVHIPDVRQCML